MASKSMRESTNKRSPQERKQALHKVLTRVNSLDEDVSTRTVLALEEVMEELDVINSETDIEEKIYNQDEVLLDSKTMNMSSMVLKRWTRSLTKTIDEYNYTEFVEKLLVCVENESSTEEDEPNWSAIASEVTQCFKRTPTYSSLLGTLTPLEKKQIVRKQAVTKEAQAPTKRPENIVSVNKEEQSVDETVKQIEKLIVRYYKKHQKPLDFFRLILHPTDFGKTTENILHTSFLIKDGVVKLTKDQSGMFFIQPCSKETIMQMKRSGNITYVQTVVNLNMEQWRILKDAYRLTQPMISFTEDKV